MHMPAYSHSQSMKSLWLILSASALLISVTVALLPEGSPVWPLAPILMVHAALLLVFGTLTIELDAQGIEWRFGFLGRPRWQLALDDIASVELTRISWLEGWGIRYTREGMLYNAHGLGAVRLRLKNGRNLRLGSDEPERLKAFIEGRLPPH
ncbi:MAG: hypothetical protein KA375_03905 [Vitreoscilla sp.]|nr:hypothetical protein [Vitreoscilla sp.]MBP6674502.1 hypothetical protein [Vitreoscilla sp.]